MMKWGGPVNTTCSLVMRWTIGNQETSVFWMQILSGCVGESYKRSNGKWFYEKLEGDSGFDLHILEQYKAIHTEVYFPNNYSWIMDGEKWKKAWWEAFDYNNSYQNHGEKYQKQICISSENGTHTVGGWT